MNMVDSDVIAKNVAEQISANITECDQHAKNVSVQKR